MSVVASLRQLEQKAAGVIAFSFPISLVLFTYERELVPLYGSGPTAFLLDKFLLAAALLSAIHPIRISVKWNFLATAIALTVAPNATYWVAVWTSRRKDPLWGPAITHAAVLVPLVFVLTTFVVEMEDPDADPKEIPTGRPPTVLRLLRGTMTFLFSFLMFRHVWHPSSFLYEVSDSQIYLALAGIFYCLWITSLSFAKKIQTAPKKKKTVKESPVSSFSDTVIKGAIITAFSAFWWKIYPSLANPVLPHPLPEVYTHPSYPLQVLSAEQSITGLITVAEWLPPPDYQPVENDEQMHSARYLRASHSILGGVWTRSKVSTIDDEPPVHDSFGTPLGDSIYATFVVQEAARMINSTEIGKAGNWKNALIIGLGTGISATSFMRHEIQTAVVEIDPAVYRAARKYFGLLDLKDNIYLEDARKWAFEKHASIESGKQETLYDIVVHDCFSGGGVPEHIFTVEFWNDLKSAMAPEGVLAVNFAGQVNSDASRLVINTLERSFGQCRAFHDMFGEMTDDHYNSEFLNMVIFCTQSSAPLTFRDTKQSDWLGSHLRRHVFKSMASREVSLDVIRHAGDDRYILTDAHNPLGALQDKQGSHHWLVMRDVLPDVQWETY